MVLSKLSSCLLVAGLLSQSAFGQQLEKKEAVEQQLKKALQSYKNDQEERAKATIASLTEQVQGDFDPEKRMQAAILLAAHYWESNFRLSRHYLGIAEGLRSPTSSEMARFDAEIQHLKVRFRQSAVQDKATKADIEKQLKANPPEPLRHSLVEMLLETNYGMGLTSEYLQTYHSYYTSYPRAARKDRLIKQAAEIYAQQGDFTHYHQLLEHLLDQYPVTTESQWALDRLIERSLAHPAKGPRYAFTYGLMKKVYRNSSSEPEQQKKILKLVQSPMRKSSDSAPAALDRYDTIRLYTFLQLYDQALSYVQAQLLEKDLSPKDAGALQNWSAYILAEKGEHLAALKQYQKQASDIIFQESEAKSFMSSKQFDLAAQEYQNLLKRKEHPRYRWYYFWNLMASGNLQSAEQFISKQPERMFVERDFRDEASRYWQAKTYISEGHMDKAKALLQPILNRSYPNYYTLLARQALVQGDAVAAQLKDRKLAEAGLSEGSELKLSPETFSSNVRLAAFTGKSPQDNDKISTTGLSTPNAQQLPYADHIKQLGKLLQIDPYLIMGIVRSESAFNSKAISIAGAQGLMQLMPYTAVRLSKVVDDKDFRLELLQSGETNLLYGSMYLTLLLDYYKGHAVPAVAAYNAGPIVVDKWLKECRGCPVDAFVEYIPYAETRSYVKKVLSAYVAYKAAETHTDPEFLSKELPTDTPAQATIF